MPSIIAAYLYNAWAFAIVHGILAIIAVRALRGFSAWNVARESPDTVWQELDQRSNFVRGIVGLFLIVGIAGTFLGLWEVASTITTINHPAGTPVIASSAPTAGSTATTPPHTIEILIEGIAKAFPVGFVGLFLTFVFTLRADWIERRKRVEIEAALRESGSGKDVVTRLEGALQPLRDLRGTLTDSLTPVVGLLLNSLQQVNVVLAAQGLELKEAKEALVEAAAGLREGAATVSESVAGLREIGKVARKSLDNAVKLSTRIDSYFDAIAGRLDEAVQNAHDSFTSLDQAVASTASEVQKTAGALRDLPADISAQLSNSLAKTVEEGRDDLRGMFGRAAIDFGDTLANAFSPVRRDFEHMQGQLGDIAKKVDEAAANVNNRLAENERLLNTATTDLALEFQSQVGQILDRTLLEGIATAAQSYAGSLREVKKTGDQFAEASSKVSNDLERIYRESAKQATESATRVAAGIDRLASAVDRAANEAATLRRPPSGPHSESKDQRPWRTKLWALLKRPISFRR